MVLAIGCARTPQPGQEASPRIAPDPAASPVASAAGSPSVSASDSAAGLAAATAPVIPAAPPGVDPEYLRLVASVCNAATLKLPNGTLAVGCPSHPPFVRPAQQPDGKLTPFTGDPTQFCALDSVYQGSFTRPGATQAVLGFAQCRYDDNDTWDSGFPGSALLVEKVEGRWKADAYVADVNTGRCLVDRRADGRDLLVCKSGFGAGAAGSMWYLFRVDFAKPEGQRAGTFARIYEDMLTCGQLDMEPDGKGLRLPQGLVSASVSDLRFARVDGGASSDIVVDVVRSRAAPSASLDARVAAACKRGPAVDQRPFVPPGVRSTLVFSLQVGDIVPTDASKRLLSAWLAEKSDHGGISAAAPPDVP